MTFAFICFIVVLICIWALLHRTGEWIHDHIVEPACIQYSSKGTSAIPAFLLVGTFFNSIARFISRFPIWYGIYWCLNYMNNPTWKSILFVGICVCISGLKRTSEDVRRHFPPPGFYKDNYGRIHKKGTEKKRYTYY